MVEMLLTGGQYHQTIASFWISDHIDSLSMSPMMSAQISSYKFCHPH